MKNDNAAANATRHCTDDSSDPCDDEGWYCFGSGGKLTRDTDKGVKSMAVTIILMSMDRCFMSG